MGSGEFSTAEEIGQESGVSRALWIDPERLRARAAAFRQIGDEVRQVMTQLQATLAAEGRWWGDDESGEAFARTYEPDVDKVLAAVRDIAAALHGFGAQISGTVDAVVAAEQTAHTRMENTKLTVLSGHRPPGDGVFPPVDGVFPPVDGPRVVETPTATAPTSTTASTSSTPVVPSVSGANPARGGTGTEFDGDAPASGEDRADRVGEGPPSPTDEGHQGVGPVDGRNEQRSSHRGRFPRDDARATREPSAARNGSPAGPGRGGIADPAGPPRGAVPSTIGAAGDRKPPSLPGAGNTDPFGSSPGQSSPAPASARREDGRSTKKDGPSTVRRPADGGRPVVAVGSASGPRVESSLVRLARRLRERHGTAVVGFDNRDLDETVVGEVFTAIDDVLTRYPVITVRDIELGDVPGGELVRVASRRPEPGAGSALSEWTVTVDEEAVTNPDGLAEVLRNPHRSEATVAGARARVVYEATVREFGRAIDRAGDLKARGRAQRTLIAEYLGADTEYRKMRLTRVVAGYRRWRDQLSGGSFDKGVFDPAAALVDAFTEVMLNGDKAVEPAKTLCRLLIDTADTVKNANRMQRTDRRSRQRPAASA